MKKRVEPDRHLGGTFLRNRDGELIGYVPPTRPEGTRPDEPDPRAWSPPDADAAATASPNATKYPSNSTRRGTRGRKE